MEPVHVRMRPWCSADVPNTCSMRSSCMGPSFIRSWLVLDAIFHPCHVQYGGHFLPSLKKKISPAVRVLFLKLDGPVLPFFLPLSLLSISILCTYRQSFLDDGASWTAEHLGCSLQSPLSLLLASALWILHTLKSNWLANSLMQAYLSTAVWFAAFLHLMAEPLHFGGIQHSCS